MMTWLFEFLSFLRSRGALILVAVSVFAGLYIVSRFNYLLFHTLVEMFSVLTAFTIFVLAWNARGYLQNGYLVFLGIGLLFVGGINLLHTLAYRGMGVFVADANLATQLWLAHRYLFSASMLAAPFFTGRPLRNRIPLILLGFGFITIVLVLSIFFWQIIPAAFIEGQGLTPFKIISEYIIILLFAAGGALLLRERRWFDDSIFRLLLASLGLNIGAEFFFTTYTQVDDIRNLGGHFLQLAAFYLIYKAVIETGFLKPQRLMFRELAAANQALRAREAELLESEGRQRLLFETLIEGFVLIEAIYGDGQIVDFRIVEINPALEQMLPATRAEILGRTVSELLPEDMDKSWKAKYAGVVTTGESIRFEARHPQSDRFYEVTAYRPSLGRCAALVSDITERRHAQEVLRQSEARLRRLVESNIIGIIFTNEDGSIHMTNDAFLGMLGLTRPEFEDGMVNWVNLTPPEYLSADIDGMAEARSQGACTPYEKEFVHLSGRRVPVLIGYAYFHEATPRYITFVLDLTERKLSEARLESYALQLERSNRELQEFAFVASHDLQEPLRKIQAFGDRLQKQADGKLNEDENLYLDRMLGAARRMSQMVTDLLELSRVTTRGKPFEPVDLNAVVQEVISDLDLRIQSSKGQVEFSNLPVIYGDPIQMHQLLQNLVGNALKFHQEDKPPVVRVFCEAVDSKTTQKRVTIYVKDEGIGFDGEFIERIFQPFQRLHGMGRYEGSGIGLAICRKIVERHAGTITAQSQPGEGATFIVTLPAA